MTNYLKIINIGLFVLQFTYYFSGIKILNKSIQKVESDKVDKKSQLNNSNVYNEDEFKNLLFCNLIVSVIISFILLSIVNKNFNDNNNISNCKFSDTDYITIFFKEFLNKSSLMKFLFAFNLAALYLSNPYMLFWTFLIIFAMILFSEICIKSNLTISSNFINRCGILFSLSTDITNRMNSKYAYILYILLFSFFCIIILLNYLMENSYSNYLYWSNFVVLILSLLFIIIKIIIYKQSGFSICDMLINFKTNKNLNSVVNNTNKTNTNTNKTNTNTNKTNININNTNNISPIWNNKNTHVNSLNNGNNDENNDGNNDGNNNGNNDGNNDENNDGNNNGNNWNYNGNENEYNAYSKS